MLIEVVASLLILVVVLLTIPVTATFQVSTQKDVQSYVDLRWLFGLARLRRALFQSEDNDRDGEEVTQNIGTFARLTRKKNLLAAMRKRAFRRRILRFIADSWRAIQKRNVNLRLRIGLGDPADTGQLWAIVGPLTGMLANVHAASFEIEPDFFDTTFEFDGSGAIRLFPIQMIYLTVGLLLSPAFWQGLKQLKSGR